MRKKSLILVILIIAVALAACFGACSELENNIKIQDTVVSRYGDGIAVLDSHYAPAAATEYRESPRVRAKINVDARMSGYHITGIYIPAGETLSITVANTIPQYGYSVVINDFSDQPQEPILISNIITNITAPRGGVVEILVPEMPQSSATALNSFDMIIEDGIVIPYYRLGRDKIENIEKGAGPYAILDCVNTRFYVPTAILYDEEKKCKIDDIYNSLLWWQSAVSFFNETLGIRNGRSDYTSSVVIGDFGGEVKYDKTRKAVVADATYFEDILFYKNVLSGTAWKLLYAICSHKVTVSDNFSSTVSETMIVDILCSIDNVVMTDIDDELDNEWSWLANPYNCLQRTNELLSLPIGERNTVDLMRAFFINIMHSYGLDKTVEIITEYGKIVSDSPKNDELALTVSNILAADVSRYFETFGLTLSQETKNKMSGNSAYIPVQTKFTVGNKESYSMGYTVSMGESTAFDFSNNIVSIMDGWQVVDVKGDDRVWSIKDGVYYYTPIKDKLTDEFSVQLRNGEFGVTLYGKVNVIITVATYKIYENWKFDSTATALDEAVKSYEKRAYDYTGSIDFVGVRRRPNVDPSTYVLTVTEGCIQVPETGKYRVYLRNNGLCRVEFGVSDFMNVIFNSTIPVENFTRYQSVDIELKNDKIYEYKLYLLSTKGGCDAAIGVRYIEDDDASDENDYGIQADLLDSEYLIYKGLTKDDIVKFEPPVIYPTGYGKKEAFYQMHTLTDKNFTSYPDASANRDINLAVDSLGAGSYYRAAKKANSYEFILNLGKQTRAEYLMLNVTRPAAVSDEKVAVGATVSLYGSNSVDFSQAEKIALDKEILESGDNYMHFSPCKYSYYKLVLSAEEQFVCIINDLKIGQYFDESQIVPNTATKFAYMGGWLDNGEYVSVNGSISESVNNNSILSFTAKTRQLCLYGVKDSKYGKMDVYIDGKLHSTVDLYSETTMTDQLLVAVDFDINTEHSIKVMPASKNDKINVDYISFIPVEEEQVKPIGGVLYYALIIPGVIVVVLLCAAIADSIEKSKKKNKKVKVKVNSDLSV